MSIPVGQQKPKLTPEQREGITPIAEVFNRWMTSLFETCEKQEPGNMGVALMRAAFKTVTTAKPTVTLESFSHETAPFQHLVDAKDDQFITWAVPQINYLQRLPIVTFWPSAGEKFQAEVWQHLLPMTDMCRSMRKMLGCDNYEWRNPPNYIPTQLTQALQSAQSDGLTQAGLMSMVQQIVPAEQLAAIRNMQLDHATPDMSQLEGLGIGGDQVQKMVQMFTEQGAAPGLESPEAMDALENFDVDTALDGLGASRNDPLRGLAARFKQAFSESRADGHTNPKQAVFSAATKLMQTEDMSELMNTMMQSGTLQQLLGQFTGAPVGELSRDPFAKGGACGPDSQLDWD